MQNHLCWHTRNLPRRPLLRTQRPQMQQKQNQVSIDLLHLILQVDLSPADKEKIVQSPDFVDFFAKSSKVIERALYVSSKYDIAVDYTEADENANNGYRITCIASNFGVARII